MVRCTTILLGIFISLAVLSLDTQDAFAKKRQEMRLYKVNKDGITQRLRFTSRKSKRPGCHNLLLKSRVFKVSQFGYKSCQVFSEKNCAADSLILFKHNKIDEWVGDLDQGYLWQPIGDQKRGQKMKSWSCSENES